ncbi:MAG: right-handed parallel beta-helix repeat-containing protein [Candidatus Eisenbacteria bacterium]
MASSAATYTVTTLFYTGPGSIDQAIIDANANPGADQITFSVSGSISLSSDLTPLTDDSTSILGDTAPTGIELHGSGATAGLRLDGASYCVIQGMTIEALTVGIDMYNGAKHNQIGQPGPGGPGNDIRDNTIGVRLRAPGTDSNFVMNNEIHGNPGPGVVFRNGPRHNQIGGLLTADHQGNRIYNNQVGITMYGANPTPVEENYILGNKIGTDGSGTTPLGNDYDGIILWKEACLLNQIIGNIIVDNGRYGVWIDSSAHHNTLEGNFIGVDRTGLAPLGNANHGVCLAMTAPSNVVGPSNVISGNGGDGVYVQTPQSSGNQIFGNVIGLNLPGDSAIGNTGNGVRVQDGTMNTRIWENVISGNGLDGVEFSGNDPQYNTVRENKIGTDANGAYDIGNGYNGVHLDHTTSLDSVVANLISGNGGYGVAIESLEATDHHISGNYIGTDETGTYAIPNDLSGILLATSRNLIGGLAEGDGNLISGNTGWGIEMTCEAAGFFQRYNKVYGNVIGMSASGNALGNGLGGIVIGDEFVDNLVGDYPTVTGAKNVIMRNNGPGVRVGEFGASGTPIENKILTNRITLNSGEGIRLVFGGNDLIYPPIITNVTGTDVSGTTNLSGLPETLVQIFYGPDDEGANYVGEVLVPAGTANWSLSTSAIPLGAHVTATNTSIWPGRPSPQTSPFSEAYLYEDTGVEQGEGLPKVFELRRTGSNPVRDGARFSFAAPVPTRLSVEVFGMNGRLIRSLTQGEIPAGLNDIRWDGRDEAGRPSPSGIYFLRAEFGEGVITKRITVIR